MNEIGLEAQVVRELAPAQVVHAAAAAGFECAGIYIDIGTWTDATSRSVRDAFAQTGVRPLEGEVIRLGDRVGDQERRLFAVAAEIALPCLIVVAMEDDADRNADLLAELGELGVMMGVKPVLEFGAFTAVRDVDAALRAVARAPELIGILPDPIHLARGGGLPADLTRIPAQQIMFAQICDAGPPPADTSAQSLLEEAKHHRLGIGEGMLPLDDFYRALPPGIPLSNEVRSLSWEQRYPDPFERAAELAIHMRRWLAHFQ